VGCGSKWQKGRWQLRPEKNIYYYSYILIHSVVGAGFFFPLFFPLLLWLLFSLWSLSIFWLLRIFFVLFCFLITLLISFISTLAFCSFVYFFFFFCCSILVDIFYNKYRSFYMLINFAFLFFHFFRGAWLSCSLCFTPQLALYFGLVFCFVLSSVLFSIGRYHFWFPLLAGPLSLFTLVCLGFVWVYVPFFLIPFVWFLLLPFVWALFFDSWVFCLFLILLVIFLSGFCFFYSPLLT